MSILKIYVSGQWADACNTDIRFRVGTSWVKLKPNDRVYLNGVWRQVICSLAYKWIIDPNFSTCEKTQTVVDVPFTLTQPFPNEDGAVRNIDFAPGFTAILKKNTTTGHYKFDLRWIVRSSDGVGPNQYSGAFADGNPAYNMFVISPIGQITDPALYPTSNLAWTGEGCYGYMLRGHIDTNGKIWVDAAAVKAITFWNPNDPRFIMRSYYSIYGSEFSGLNPSINTGWSINLKKKKVTDNSSVLPLDVNNQLTSQSGLAQDTIDIPTTDPDYRTLNANCAVDAVQYGNDELSVDFTKACDGGQTGEVLPYVVPVNTYFANSKAAANSLAQADVANNGQAYANLYGQCVTSPVPFYFADAVGVAASTAINSAPAIITGLTSPTPIVVSGGLYSIDGGSFTGASGVISNGQSLRLQRVSSSSPLTQVMVEVTVGSYTTSFKITTAVANPARLDFNFVKSTNPVVDLILVANDGVNNFGPKFATENGTFSSSIPAGSMIYVGIAHETEAIPWPADSVAYLAILKNSVEILNSGPQTNPAVNDVAHFSFVAEAGAVYDIIAQSSSTSSLYRALDISIINNSYLPLAVDSVRPIEVTITDQTPTALQVLKIGQYANPQAHVGFNAKNDANLLTVKVEVDYDVTGEVYVSLIDKYGYATGGAVSNHGVFTATNVPKNSLTVQVDDYVPVPTVPCGTSTGYSGGQSYPTEQVISLGSGLGTVTLNGNAYNIPDKFVLIFDGVEVINTGYRGDSVWQNALDNALALRSMPSEPIVGVGAVIASFNKTTATTTAILRVYAPMSSTAWDVTISCPTP